MECLAGAWNIVPSLWQCSAKHAKYIVDLEDNLASLRSEGLKLMNISADVRTKVREAEEQQKRARNQVNGWLASVEAMEKELNMILHKGDQELGNKCLGRCCPKNCGSSYKIGKKVLKMIPRVAKLTEEGEKFDVVADPLPPPAVDELAMDNVVVGFESKFEEVWQSVQNKDSTIVGLVGMGGVGKTTLLKQLNNQFLNATHAYDLVIWIVVSKPANVVKIRDALRSKLDIRDDLWVNKSEDQKHSLIFSKLKNKKFMVLLDDMWETLELSEVGIPRPDMDSPGSKIVFTTRSREVCQSMGADKVIRVDCLPPDQAFSLFYTQLGEDILRSHPEMQELIIDVASECECLPLALITIGRAMRGKTDPQQWEEAKRTLEKYPSTFPGMEGIFSRIVFSYDSLPNPMVKKCFEYCALYPEDHNILVEEVIKLWVAEGFIGEYDSMYDALIQGRQIVEILKQACLLETGEMPISYWSEKQEETVRMHDVIRDMALWIACERGEKENKFCVRVATGDQDVFTIAPNATTNAEKISLWGNGITTQSLAGMSFSPNLSTLIIQDTGVRALPGEIVHSMDALKVLHFSCHMMELLIENGCFTNLEYLNIVYTDIIWPAEGSQWKKLRFLIVGNMVSFPKEFISSLCSLQMFEQCYISQQDIPAGSDDETERGMLSELEGLKHIMDIRLVLYTATGIEKLLDSPKLQSCTTRLVLNNVVSSTDTLDFGTGTLMKHLERFEVHYCRVFEIKVGRPSLRNSLCEVRFFSCNGIQNLSSLIYVPNLSVLEVRWCESMSELIGEETRSSNVGTTLFSRLKSLTLGYSGKLRSICPQSALPFPSLEFMEVYKCKSLVKLPLDSNTARTTPPQLKIRGQEWWWDGLEWDSQATKDAFTPKFIMRR